jgi:hypothetical protein
VRTSDFFDWRLWLAGVIGGTAAIVVLFGTFHIIKSVNPELAYKLLESLISAIRAM